MYPTHLSHINRHLKLLLELVAIQAHKLRAQVHFLPQLQVDYVSHRDTIDIFQFDSQLF